MKTAIVLMISAKHGIISFTKILTILVSIMPSPIYLLYGSVDGGGHGQCAMLTRYLLTYYHTKCLACEQIHILHLLI